MNIRPSLSAIVVGSAMLFYWAKFIHYPSVSGGCTQDCLLAYLSENAELLFSAAASVYGAIFAVIFSILALEKSSQDLTGAKEERERKKREEFQSLVDDVAGKFGLDAAAINAEVLRVSMETASDINGVPQRLSAIAGHMELSDRSFGTGSFDFDGHQSVFRKLVAVIGIDLTTNPAPMYFDIEKRVVSFLNDILEKCDAKGRLRNGDLAYYAFRPAGRTARLRRKKES